MVLDDSLEHTVAELGPKRIEILLGDGINWRSSGGSFDRHERSAYSADDRSDHIGRDFYAPPTQVGGPLQTPGVASAGAPARGYRLCAMSVVASPGAAPPLTAPAPLIAPCHWIHDRRTDAVITFLWVPFSLAAAAAYSTPAALGVVVALTLLTSLVHQPLTLGLIYGDPAQFAVARRVFTVFPFVLLGAVIVARSFSLTLVAVIAGLWNAEHTLMQRYGISRIYARKAGETGPARERPMLISWLVFALSFAAADPRTTRLLDRVELGATNEEGVRVLQTLRPWAVGAVIVAGMFVVWATTRWWLGERQLRRIGWTPKRRYLFGTALLFAVILVNPIVGLIGYVGSHALEYFVIVHGALGRRYSGPQAQPGGVVGRVVRSPLRASGCVVVYVALVGIALVSVQKLLDADIGNTVLLTVGGMHVFFDGFIWKLRRPVVAHSVAAG